MKNAIAWFEIPTTQLDRAQTFYEAVLGQPLRRENMGPSEGAVFPYDGAAGGDERRPQHQVFRRVAGDIEFWKENEVGPGHARGSMGLPSFGEIGRDRADGRVELGEGDDKTVGHVRLLA